MTLPGGALAGQVGPILEPFARFLRVALPILCKRPLADTRSSQRRPYESTVAVAFSSFEDSAPLKSFLDSLRSPSSAAASSTLSFALHLQDQFVESAAAS